MLAVWPHATGPEPPDPVDPPEPELPPVDDPPLQCPTEQLLPDPQTTPQPPQLFGSVEITVQAFPHAIWLASHSDMQFPFTQNVAPVQDGEHVTSPPVPDEPPVSPLPPSPPPPVALDPLSWPPAPDAVPTFPPAPPVPPSSVEIAVTLPQDMETSKRQSSARFTGAPPRGAEASWSPGEAWPR